MHFRHVFNIGFTLFLFKQWQIKRFSPKLTPGNTRETLFPFSLHRHGFEIRKQEKTK